MNLEANCVVKSCKDAVVFYETVLAGKRGYLTELAQGENEATIVIGGMQLHLFDENENFSMKAPRPGDNNYMWWHCVVENIEETVGIAKENGATIDQPIQELEDYGVKQVVMIDPFGYSWILTQVVREISNREAEALYKTQNNG